MSKTNKTENVEEVTVEENNSPMGTLEQIKTIPEAPRPVGELVKRQIIKTVYLTNYSNEDFPAQWDGKTYIYSARTKAPVSIGGYMENGHVQRKWAVELARREYYRDNPPAVGGKSRLPKEAELEKYVQKAIQDAPLGDVELGNERSDETKSYHVLKSPSAFAELSAQM